MSMRAGANLCIALSLSLSLVFAGCSDDDSKPPPKETGVVVDQRVVDTGTTVDTGAPDQGATDTSGSDLSTTSFRTCQRQCTQNDDCCQTPPCDKMPKNSFCQPSGYCFNKGCAADTDCRSGTGFKCLTFMNMGLCGLPCSVDTQCAGAGASNVCVAGTFCSNAATKKLFECTNNADCNSTTAEDTCDTGSGFCGCSDDAKCQTQYASAYGGVWKCVGFKL